MKVRPGAVPASIPLPRISPTDFEWLRRCPRHMAWRTSFARAHHRRKSSPAQVLGIIVHNTMRAVLSTDCPLLADDWEAAVAATWADQVAKAEDLLRQNGDTLASPAGSWPNYQEKRLLTLRLARRVRNIVQPSGGAKVLPEETLRGFGDRLVGVADLILRSPNGSSIFDYKTGEINAPDGGALKSEYERQLLLYAAMEHETTNKWPTVLQVLPLEGSPTAVDPDPAGSTQLAAEALAALDAYNSSTPAAQIANPGPHCLTCDYAVQCEAFWEWHPDAPMDATDALVIEVHDGALGGATLDLSPLRDPEVPVRVHAIERSVHPAVSEVRIGDRIRIVGMRARRSGDGYWLTPGGRIAIVDESSA